MSMEAWELGFWEMLEEMKMEALAKFTDDQLLALVKTVSREMQERIVKAKADAIASAASVEAATEDLASLQDTVERMDNEINPLASMALDAQEEAADKLIERREKRQAAQDYSGINAYYRDLEGR